MVVKILSFLNLIFKFKFCEVLLYCWNRYFVCLFLVVREFGVFSYVVWFWEDGIYNVENY